MNWNQGWTYYDRVDSAAAGMTVLDYYSQRYSHSSRSQWLERIQAGQIHLQNQPVTAETRLRQGQQLAYHRPPWQEPPVPLEFEVVYEDAEVLVINKPSGLPVLPGGGFLEHTLLGQLRHRYPAPAPVPVHRLGRGTSGLLLLARSPESSASLSQQMRQHQIGKRYRALVQGLPTWDTLTITQPIGKVPYPVLGLVYAAQDSGMAAQSDCHVLERRDRSTLLQVEILTGRPHQIRIHTARVGHPLVGDPFYGHGGLPQIDALSADGSLPVLGDCGYHLHAYELTFTHPTQGQPIHLTCAPPAILEPGFRQEQQSP